MEMMEKLKLSKSMSKKEKSELKKLESSEKKEDGEGEDDKEVDDPLKRTNVPFGGCIKEIK